MSCLNCGSALLSYDKYCDQLCEKEYQNPINRVLNKATREVASWPEWMRRQNQLPHNPNFTLIIKKDSLDSIWDKDWRDKMTMAFEQIGILIKEEAAKPKSRWHYLEVD